MAVIRPQLCSGTSTELTCASDLLDYSNSKLLPEAHLTIPTPCWSATRKLSQRSANCVVGYTFYAQRWQRTHVNTTCKLLLLRHAFETLCCQVVGFRVDNLNSRSQQAVEALGATKDGIIRHFEARPDGSARDSHMYSILAREWPEVRQHLEQRLRRHGR